MGAQRVVAHLTGSAEDVESLRRVPAEPELALHDVGHPAVGPAPRRCAASPGRRPWSGPPRTRRTPRRRRPTSSGKSNPLASAKRSCAATESRLMPTRWAPTASKSAERVPHRAHLLGAATAGGDRIEEQRDRSVTVHRSDNLLDPVLVGQLEIRGHVAGLHARRSASGPRPVRRVFHVEPVEARPPGRAADVRVVRRLSGGPPRRRRRPGRCPCRTTSCSHRRSCTAAPSVYRYAVPFSAASISAGVAVGSAWNSWATMPAMCGAAIDVPLMVLKVPMSSGPGPFFGARPVSRSAGTAGRTS